MNEAELERAIAKLKAQLLMDKGEENSSANGEIRRRLVRLQMLRIKLKEIEEVSIHLQLLFVYWAKCACDELHYSEVHVYINFDTLSYISNQALSINVGSKIRYCSINSMIPSFLCVGRSRLSQRTSSR